MKRPLSASFEPDRTGRPIDGADLSVSRLRMGVIRKGATEGRSSILLPRRDGRAYRFSLFSQSNSRDVTVCSIL